ncbi:MAG: hypothetical protein HY519_01995 [Candidatus Aenigmarchaeota archaeon]|nr:hypothetical protein [Candidatus Aenigmarchaeota archaeon]
MPLTFRIVAFLSLVVLALVPAVPSQQSTLPISDIPVVFHLPDAEIHAAALVGSLRMHLNHERLFTGPLAPWRKDAASGLAPHQPFILSADLLFDDGGRNIRPAVERLQAFLKAHQTVPFGWAGSEYRGKVESFNVKYTLFLPDGSPVRATANINLSSFVPADDGHRGSPAQLDYFALLDASQQSFLLLKQYDAETLDRVAGQLFANLQPETRAVRLTVAQPGRLQQLSAFSIGPPEAGKNFTIEISGANGSGPEGNSWASCSGGTLDIEVSDASVGRDQFQTAAPGHKSLEPLTLRGPMTASRKALMDWVNQKGRPCPTCKNVSLAFSQGNVTQWAFAAPVIDAFYFRNQILLLHTQGDRLHATVLNIARSHADGSACSGPPRIFILLPTSGPAYMPIGIGGTNFGAGAVPYVNGATSSALFNFNTQNLPLIGSLSVGVTLVPPAAPGNGSGVQVEYFSQRSNRFPFTVN